MKRKRKYDIIIYLSLAVAIVCLALSAFDYTTSLKTGDSMVNKDSERIPELNKEEEPAELAILDKKTIIKTYMNQVLDQIIKDEIISYSMMKTWGEYEIIDITFHKEIIDGYYEYEANISINNKDALIPCEINHELSTEEYNVITLIINIVKNNKDNTYTVKSLNKMA